MAIPNSSWRVLWDRKPCMTISPLETLASVSTCWSSSTVTSLWNIAELSSLRSASARSSLRQSLASAIMDLTVELTLKSRVAVPVSLLTRLRLMLTEARREYWILTSLANTVRLDTCNSLSSKMYSVFLHIRAETAVDSTTTIAAMARAYGIPMVFMNMVQKTSPNTRPLSVPSRMTQGWALIESCILGPLLQNPDDRLIQLLGDILGHGPLQVLDGHHPSGSRHGQIGESEMAVDGPLRYLDLMDPLDWNEGMADYEDPSADLDLVGVYPVAVPAEEHHGRYQLVCREDGEDDTECHAHLLPVIGHIALQEQKVEHQQG